MNNPELPEENATLQQMIEWAELALAQSDVYFGHGTDNAHDEAAYLLSYALDISPYFDDSKLGYVLTNKEKQTAEELIRQRIETKKPAAYLTHEAWYMGVPFYVDENVLVPRSPIAEVIAEYFQPWIQEENIHRILDLCTGSGCLAILSAMAFPEARVDATDLSPAALDVARKNVEQHQLQQRVQVIESDLFSSISDEKYDVIISNPPYVDARDMSELPDEYRHEPEMALAAGHDGLDLVIPMLCQAPLHLNEQGIFIVEVGNSEEALQNIFPDVPFMWLDFEFGGEGVFLLDKQQLQDYQHVFLQELTKRNLNS